MKHTTRKIMTALLVAACATNALPAFAHGPSDASAQSSLGVSLVTGSVVIGTMTSVAEGSKVVVEGIEKVGDGIVYVLKNLSTGATVSIKVSGTVAGTVSVGVGTAVTVVADASGYALMASGKVIAYIPNEVGKSLLHNRKSVERAQS